MKEYQVTLVAANGKYRPVSCIIKAEKYIKTEVLRKGIEKICMKRGWSGADLKKFTYTTAKVREYDKEKIALENAARYEAIKEEKYATGEWKRPKNKG